MKQRSRGRSQEQGLDQSMSQDQDLADSMEGYGNQFIQDMMGSGAELLGEPLAEQLLRPDGLLEAEDLEASEETLGVTMQEAAEEVVEDLPDDAGGGGGGAPPPGGAPAAPPSGAPSGGPPPSGGGGGASGGGDGASGGIFDGLAGLVEDLSDAQASLVFAGVGAELVKLLDEETLQKALQAAGIGPDGEQDDAKAAEGGTMMADRESSNPVDDGDEVMDLVQESSSSDLPKDTADKLSGALGHDLSHVRIHTDAAAAKAAEAINAHAFALGDDVFFGSGEFKPGTAEGDELIAHELTHVVQFDEGRLPSGGGEMDVSSPSDSAEEEARTAASAVQDSLAEGSGDIEPSPAAAPLPSGGQMSAAPLAGGTAMRRERPGGDDGPSAPDQVTLALQGLAMEARVPSSASPGSRATVQVQASDIQGVTVATTQVDFDEDFRVVGGSMQVTVDAGPYVEPVTTSLDVRVGGGVDNQIGEARLNLGDVMTGSVQLQAGPDGVSGRGVIQGSDVNLGHGLETDGGTLEVTVDTDGTVRAVGSITGRIEGLGSFEMMATGENEELTGMIHLTVDPGISLGDGVTIEGGELVGMYDGSGCTLAGEVDFNVGEWAQGRIEGQYDAANQLWNATGTLDQVGEHVVGEGVELHSGTLEIQVSDNELLPARAFIGVTFEGFEAVVEGEYDLLTDTLNATGEVTLTEDRELIDGTTLTAFTGTATIADNVLVEVTGEATAEVLYEGEPTFEVTLSETTFQPQENLLSGEASVTTLRELTIGPEDATHLVVAEGATATATVDSNVLQQIDGNLAFTAVDEVGDFGAGTASVTFTGAGSSVDAEVTFSFTTEYGIPERSSTTAYFRPGGEIVATVTGGELQTITANALPFTVKSPDEQGQVDGTFDGTLDFQSDQFNGTLRGELVEEWPLDVDFGELAFTPGGTVVATIADSELTTVEGDLPFRSTVEGEVPIELEGMLSGTLDVPGATINGTGNATLVEDVPFDLEEGDQIIMRAGSTLTVPVVDNQVELLNVAVDAAFLTEGAEMATGTLNGDFTTADGTFTGTADLTLSQDLPLENAESGDGERIESWELGIAAGSTVQADIDANELQRTQIDSTAYLDRDGERIATGTMNGEYKLGDDAEGFTGTLNAQLLTRVDWEEGERFEYKLDVGTTFDAQVEQNALLTADGTFVLAILEDGTDKAVATVQASYSPGTGVSATGTLEVTDDILAWEEGDDSLWVTVGSTGSATVEDDELTYIEGTLVLRYDEEADPLLQGTFTAAYDLSQGTEAVIDALGEVVTLRDLELGEGDGELSYFLEEGSAVNASVAASQLEELTGSATIRVEDDQGAFLLGTLEGTYTHGDAPDFTGTGSIEVTRETDLGITEGEYSLWLIPGAGATATIQNLELQEITGNVPMRLDDEEGPLVEIELQGTYDYQGEVFDGTGSAEIVREKEMGSSGDFTMHLIPGSGAQVTIAANVLTEIAGTITTRVDVESEPFADIMLDGTWTEAAGFGGVGQANLLVEEYEAAEMGAFTLFIRQGAGAAVTIEANELTEITADIPIAIKKDGGDFLDGQVSGTYDFPNELFSGAGSMEVIAEQQLAEFNGETFWLLPGSGAQVDITDNEVTNIGGNVNLSLRDTDEYLTLQFGGALDLTGDTPSFTGGGEATITREKRLFDAGGYAFALDEGAGASASIEDNQITSVTGNIPFKVYQGEGDALLRGQVSGDWDATTGLLNGSGEVFLARDEEYGPVTIKEGSGGSGVVVDSQLTEFTGSIEATLSDSEGPLVDLNATGTFDAVENMIVELEGGAELLRAIEPIPGIVISDVSGQGRIEENEIKEVEGGGRITIEMINLTGEFNAGWRNDGGEDVYWGSATGTLDFNQDMEGPGRGVESVTVAGELFEDESFELSGGVRYNLTEDIGGEIEIEMDQEIDPVLSGTLEASGTLVEGRELFKWEKTFLQGTAMAGPIPIGYGIKGAMGMDLDPLTYDTSFGIENFHILQLNVPDFEANLALNSGVTFYAMIAPYVGIGVSYSILELIAGLEGQARADVNAGVGLEGTLRGSGDEFTGELGVGVSIVPSLTLALDAFARAGVMGRSAEARFNLFSYTFDDLFEMGWESTYTFGDREEVSDGASVVEEPTPAVAPETYASEGDSPPDLGVGNATSGRSGNAGGPQVGGEDVQSGEGEASDMGDLGEMMEKAEALADGVDGLSRLKDIVGWNPLASLADVVMNFDEVKEAVEKVINAISVAGQLLMDVLPDWWERLKEYVDKGIGFIADAAGMVWDGAKFVAGAIADGVRAVGDGIGRGARAIGRGIRSLF